MPGVNTTIVGCAIARPRSPAMRARTLRTATTPYGSERALTEWGSRSPLRVGCHSRRSAIPKRKQMVLVARPPARTQPQGPLDHRDPSRQSLTLVRAAAAELLGPMPLDDALELCLLFLELDPEPLRCRSSEMGRQVDPRAPAGGRRRPASALSDRRPGSARRRAGAEALICLCERYQLDRGERILIPVAHEMQGSQLLASLADQVGCTSGATRLAAVVTADRCDLVRIRLEEPIR